MDVRDYYNTIGARSLPVMQQALSITRLLRFGSPSTLSSSHKFSYSLFHECIPDDVILLSRLEMSCRVWSFAGYLWIFFLIINLSPLFRYRLPPKSDRQSQEIKVDMLMLIQHFIVDMDPEDFTQHKPKTPRPMQRSA
jgi:hypothetical protein